MLNFDKCIPIKKWRNNLSTFFSFFLLLLIYSFNRMLMQSCLVSNNILKNLAPKHFFSFLCVKNVGHQTLAGPHWLQWYFFLHTMKVNGYRHIFGYQLSSKYLLLCSAEERNSHRFGTNLGWVNDDRMYIFVWNNPLIGTQNILRLKLLETA